MSDFSYTEESDEENYFQLKKNIKEIITKVMSEEDKSEGSQKGGKKITRKDRSEDLMSQFLEVREFQKKLAESLKSNNKETWRTITKNNKKKQPTVQKCESNSDTSHPSISSPCNNKLNQDSIKKPTEKTLGTEKGVKVDNQSKLSLVDEFISKEEMSSSEESDSSISSLSEDSGQDNTSKNNSKESFVNNSHDENHGVTSDVKGSAAKSTRELELIKNLCKGLIRKEIQPTDNTVSPKETMDETQLEKSTSTESHQCARRNSNNLVLDVLRNEIPLEKKTLINDLEHFQTPRHENCITDQFDKVDEGCRNKIDLIVEQKKETALGNKVENVKIENSGINENHEFPINISNYEYDENKYQGIEMEKESSEKIKHLKESKETSIEREFFEISDKYVQTTLLNDFGEERKIQETNMKDIPKVEMNIQEKYPVCNKSDDELIRQTVQELEMINENMKVEESMFAEEKEYYLELEGLGGGDRNTNTLLLAARIDQLYEEIRTLKAQLEEIKNHNEQEAMEITNISSALNDQCTPHYRNGLQWEDWELKEMVRERLREKREAAALDYQTRLRVVEALCSAEMGKLEEAYKALAPLNATASCWDPVSHPSDLSSSWMTQDYFLEVITSMNLSSTDNKTSPELLANGDVPPLVGPKPESQ